MVKMAAMGEMLNPAPEVMGARAVMVATVPPAEVVTEVMEEMQNNLN
jgi:hypothetical protein